MWPDPLFLADLVTFTKRILKGSLSNFWLFAGGFLLLLEWTLKNVTLTNQSQDITEKQSQQQLLHLKWNKLNKLFEMLLCNIPEEEKYKFLNK